MESNWYPTEVAHWMQRELFPRFKKGLRKEDVPKIWPPHYLFELLAMERLGIINKAAVGKVTAIMEERYWQQHSS